MRKAPKKEKKWSVANAPGPHSAEESIPLSSALRDNLKIARNRKEAEKILGRGEVEVDGKVRKDPKYPLGFMDIVRIPQIGKSWRILYDKKGYLRFHEIDEGESKYKLAKIVGKHPFKGGKSQLSLHDGKTIVGDFGDIRVDDTVKVSLPDLEVEERISCRTGNLALIIGGKNVGRKGEIKEIIEIEGTSSDRFLIKTEKEEFQSPEQYIFVIGEESKISLPE